MEKLSIKKWAEDDRPREKLICKGIDSLSDVELLAILIGSGYKEVSAVDLAKHLLNTCGNNLNTLARYQLNDLLKIKGIGTAKAVNILASLELGKRRQGEEVKQNSTIHSSKDVFNLMQMHLSDLKIEEFWVLYLSKSNAIIHKQKISQGGISATVVDVQVVMKTALDVMASGIILCHNHPSGNLQVSQADNQITEQIQKAANLFNIKVLDHIVIANQKYYSYADHQKI